jgi:hypothetical protein
MPYCRKCGVKLADDARFCYNCGDQVIPVPFEQASPVQQTPRIYQSQPLRKNPLFIPVMVIIALTVSALVISAVAAAPLSPVNFSRQSTFGHSGFNKVNLDFQADIGDIHVYTNLTGDEMLLMDVSATGATSLFGSNQPVTFTVQNSTDGNSQNVTVHVYSSTKPLFNTNLHVVCNIYINPQADLTLSVKSEVGDVYMDASLNIKLLSLTLKTTTGNTHLTMQKGTIVRGDMTLSTSTGNIELDMSQAEINGNRTINLDSGTGDINMNIMQIQKLNGNLQVSGHTGIGNIYLDRLVIDGEVAARIVSEAGLGRITIVGSENFNGDQSPVESNNYPAPSVINLNLNTGLGNIELHPVYATTAIPVVRN